MSRRLLSFPVLSLGIAALAALAGWRIHARYREVARAAAPSPPPPARSPLDAAPSPAPPPRPTPTPEPPTPRLTLPDPPPAAESTPSIPKSIRDLMLASPEPLNLYLAPAAAPLAPPPPSLDFAPYGRLIRCRLRSSLESSNLATPLIALTLESVWNRGPDGVAREIIPAGTEVHGPAAALTRTRNRLAISGSFTLVWRTRDPDNADTIELSGIALTRDPGIDGAGFKDASAGLEGELIETTDYAELKLFASTFLAAAAVNSFQTTNALNPLTNDIVTAKDMNVRNAATNGIQAVMTQWADRIRRSIDQEGYYVLVPAGREFYLYVTQEIVLANARRHGRSPAPRQ